VREGAGGGLVEKTPAVSIATFGTLGTTSSKTRAIRASQRPPIVRDTVPLSQFPRRGRALPALLET
jgi:hypothetical protein